MIDNNLVREDIENLLSDFKYIRYQGVKHYSKDAINIILDIIFKEVRKYNENKDKVDKKD